MTPNLFLLPIVIESHSFSLITIRLTHTAYIQGHKSTEYSHIKLYDKHGGAVDVLRNHFQALRSTAKHYVWILI